MLFAEENGPQGVGWPLAFISGLAEIIVQSMEVATFVVCNLTEWVSPFLLANFGLFGLLSMAGTLLHLDRMVERLHDAAFFVGLPVLAFLS